MSHPVALALSAASLLGWLALALLRGGFWRVRFPPPAPEPTRWPTVVAVVPARDEAQLIRPALRSLLRQEYPGPYHVVVVDDHSADATAAVAQDTAAQLGMLGKLTVIAARELPRGWTGKVWAQAEGLRVQWKRFPHARYVWLTDADIEHGTTTLRELVARAEAGQCVLASLMARLRCVSLAEKALVPAFVFFFAMLYPFQRVNDAKSRVAAAAGGCMLARTDALAAAGGIAAIRDALIDDCTLAALLKQAGPIRLDLARSSRSLRAYEGCAPIWDMIARSAYTQLRLSPALLVLTALGLLLLFAVPVACTLLAWPAPLAWLLMMGLYTPMLRYYGRSLLWAPALPLVAMFYLAATIASSWRFYRGRGGYWKGRAQAMRGRVT
jgi:hopene-associated glycosyltransferase HpnB